MDRTSEVRAPVVSTPDRPSRPRAVYALTILTLIGVMNWADRSIIAILVDPIKLALHASDTAMGVLNGFGFAVFYAFAAIPIARLADRGSRRNVLAVSVIVWSAMTALCGAASSFTQLLFARFGVGAGESAAVPTSQALIVDFFPQRQRAFALSVHSASIYIGTTFAAVVGGYLGYTFGWKVALLAVSGPGLVLGALLWLTTPEPPRSGVDPLTATARPRFGETLALLLGNPAFTFAVGATAMGAVVNGAMAAWTAGFLGRVYHMNLKELGLAYGLVKGLTGVAGVLLGGGVVVRAGLTTVRRQLLFCAAAILVAVPFFIAFLASPSIGWGLLALGVFQVFTTMPIGVSYAVIQDLSPPSSRALAAATLALVSTLIGIGGGPVYVGALADAFHPAYGQGALRYALMLLIPFMLLGAAGYLAGARASLGRRERKAGDLKTLVRGIP